MVFCMRKTTEERFWIKIDKNGPIPKTRPDLGPCWMWTAAKNQGYGIFWNGEHRDNGSDILVPAHRFSYELLVGSIPLNFHIDHLCRNPSCVNPAHLEPVTCRENLLRGQTIYAANAAKTMCPKGHDFDAENTYLSKRNERKCRTCHRDQERERKYRTGLRKRPEERLLGKAV